jgi:hypothetical protein
MPADRDGEIGAQGIEGAVRQVDDAAQAENQRQAKRQQDVIGPDQKAVGHVLQDDKHCPGTDLRRGRRNL